MTTPHTLQVQFFDRDMSWLSFNERVLMEAEKETVPLMERLKFLAIYSSNLDEFYRVRIASIMALSKLNKSNHELLTQVNWIIQSHQNRYGKILIESIIPALARNGIAFLYNTDLPDTIAKSVSDIFFTSIARHLHVVMLSQGSTFFPENNKCYFAITPGTTKDIFIVNIPSDTVSRFQAISTSDKTYVVMIDDIIERHLDVLFGTTVKKKGYAFKITRDAELNLKDEVAGSLTHRMEKRLAKRDFGLATRFLYDEEMPKFLSERLIEAFKLKHAIIVRGGHYHNLKDFFGFPLAGTSFEYPKQRPMILAVADNGSVFTRIDRADTMVHTPYHSYDLILRFFNEAAIDPAVEKIYVTLYRIAKNSGIALSLMTAARNGKKVYVMVELKARFDEANNIRWSKKMKEAGVKIVYSSEKLKVHAKIALVKRKKGIKAAYYGLLSTGNFNENTASLYTDHVLLTAHAVLLKEVQSVFNILLNKEYSVDSKKTKFKSLIVAPINIRERFFELIDREIAHARKGKKSAIIIKLNNLEEETLIKKLYEASSAGVQIQLIVRSICRLVPGVEGLSDNITVRRIVDRYLEHGRVFLFHNGGQEQIYCGSADWMNRNIYHRVEVCFPIYSDQLRNDLKRMLSLQLEDTEQAVEIDTTLANLPMVSNGGEKVRSQQAIYEMLWNGIDQV